MADFKQTAAQVLAAVGGKDNVSSVTHCMTRLRFVLKDADVPNKEEVAKIKGVVGVNIAGGQYQIIIGNSVANVYKEILALGVAADGVSASGKKEKVNPISAAIDFIAGCMTPLFTSIIAGGLIKVLLVIFGPTLLGVMDATSDTYILMNALGDAPFYFLPVLVAFTAAKKLGCNAYLSVMVSSMLLYPDLITLLGGDAPTYLFGVIPVTHGSYASSIIPAMLATLLLKYIEIGVDKITPDWSKNFLKPLLIVVITAPITLCLLAPLGLMIGNVLQMVINGIYGFAPFLAMLLFAGAMPFIVMTGMHWAFVPACLMSLADPGFELMLLPAMLCSNTAQAGATFGVAFKSKEKDTKQMAFPAAISALLAGVTEPAMYVVTLRLKKPMIAACIAGAVGGVITSILNLKAYAFATPCLTAIVQFIAPDGGNNFLYACIVFGVVFVISFVLSFILTPAHETSEADEVTAAPALSDGKTEIVAPILGKVIPLTDVKDSTFASGVLGEGFAIEPSEGKVYAPFDGTCDNLFDTLHAMGLVSDNGVELLIHVGLETVGLGGKPFTAHIKTGDKFKKGDLLLEFDMDAIKAAGCETQTPVIITNAEDVGSITVEGDKIVIGG